MSKNTRKLAPKLRFPEFQDAGEWDEKPLGECLDYQQPTPYLVSDTRYSDAYETPVLTAGKTFILGFTNEKNGIFKDNLPVIIFDDFTTATQFVDFPFKAKSSAMKILQAINGANIKFMYESLQIINYEVGAHERHWISKFAPMPILAPKPSEQQKIANCLSSIDDLITAQSQKVEALKTHKKGLMQQLFPREGETVPRLRFPEFRDAGEWVISQLQEFSTIIRGASPRPQGDPRYYGGKVPRLMGKDVSRDGKWVTPSCDFLTEEGAKLSRFCKKGTLTIICSGDVGVPSFLAVDACIHDGFLALIDLAGEVIDQDFLFYSLINLQTIFTSSATHGGVFVNLTTTILKEFEIYRPCILEQQKIANCLSSIDELITAQTQKLEFLKIHKRGLMQQLFPSTEAVK